MNSLMVSSGGANEVGCVRGMHQSRSCRGGHSEHGCRVPDDGPRVVDAGVVAGHVGVAAFLCCAVTGHLDLLKSRDKRNYGICKRQQ